MIHLYKNGTQGERDGIRLSEGTELLPADDRLLESTVDQETSPIALMARCDPGETTVGLVTMTPVRGTSPLWNLAWGNAPNTWAGWGQTLSVVDGIDDRNRPVFAKYKVLAGEPTGSDISTDIHIEARLGLFQSASSLGDTKRIVQDAASSLGDTVRIVTESGALETGWFLYDTVSFPSPFFIGTAGIASALIGDEWYLFNLSGTPPNITFGRYNIPNKEYVTLAGVLPPTPTGAYPAGFSRAIPAGDTIYLASYAYNAVTLAWETVLYSYFIPTGAFAFVAEREGVFGEPYGVDAFWHNGGTFYFKHPDSVRVWSWDGATWGEGPNLPFPLQQSIAVRDGDFLYLIIGAGNPGPSSDNQFSRLNLLSNTWEILPFPPVIPLSDNDLEGLAGSGGVLSDGNLYCINGWSTSWTWRWNGSEWEQDTWTTYPRFQHEAAQQNLYCPSCVYDWGGLRGKELFTLGGNLANFRMVSHYTLTGLS